MTSYRVQYSEEAFQDLRDIYEYIAFEIQEPRIASAQINRIRETVDSLRTFPERNKIVDWEPWSSLGMRQTVVDNFIVFYLTEKESEQVQIVRIIYGKRDIPTIANRK